MNDLISFKTPVEKEQLDSGKLHPRLLAVLLALATWMWLNYRRGIIITSIWRKKTTDSGVHEAWRGVDIRTSDWPGDAAEKAVEWLNSTFSYDPSRPTLQTALHHEGTGDYSGIHLHLQVSGKEGAWE